MDSIIIYKGQRFDTLQIQSGYKVVLSRIYDSGTITLDIAAISITKDKDNQIIITD